jgi:hypothetical protein
MSDKALWYSAFAAWGTWAAVVTGLIVLLIQRRTSIRLTSLQLFMQLVAQYDSADMQRLRSDLARRLLVDPETLVVNDSLLVFYENLAIMVRRRLLDRDLVRNMFSIDVRSYWMALRPYVAHMRASFRDECFFEEFEWLNDYFVDLESRVGPSPNSEVGSPESIKMFLSMEAQRGPVATPRSNDVPALPVSRS